MQGYLGPVHGNQRGLAGGFGISTGEWSGWTVTKVEVQLNFDVWLQGTGTAKIGSHKHTSRPASDPDTNSGRTTVTGWRAGQSKWVNVTSWGKGLASNTLKGVVIGPGPDQSGRYYGVASGADKATRPQIRITGYRWE